MSGIGKSLSDVPLMSTSLLVSGLFCAMGFWRRKSFSRSLDRLLWIAFDASVFLVVISRSGWVVAVVVEDDDDDVSLSFVEVVLGESDVDGSLELGVDFVSDCLESDWVDSLSFRCSSLLLRVELSSSSCSSSALSLVSSCRSMEESSCEVAVVVASVRGVSELVSGTAFATIGEVIVAAVLDAAYTPTGPLSLGSGRLRKRLKCSKLSFYKHTTNQIKR